MALVVKDRVKVYSSTTGTGTLSLGSAFAGFQTFNNALGDGDTTYYGIFESSTGNWEVGLGTYTSSGNTLSRDTILESSNAGAAVNLTADTEVFITYPAEKSVYFDASGDLILNQDPTSNLQAATKQYVDTIAAAGLHYHAPVRVQTTANLTATYNNGSSGVGATLTNSGTQAAISIDNVTLSSADRVLVSEQTNAAHNGVYTVTNVGSASTNWVLTRATDADSYGPSDPDSLGEGDAFFIKEGDTNAGHLDVMTTSGEIVFGTTNIVFSEVAETTVYSAGTGLSLSGTEFNVGAGTGITVDATTVSTVQDIATSATPQFDGLTTTGNITFGDNDKAIFGAGSDLQIYHDGSNSYIKDAGTGDLKIQGANVRLENPSGVRYFQGSSGNAYLYNSGDIKLATTSTGIDVTGTVTADGLTVDKTDTATYSSTAVDDTLVITRKNSSGTNNQVVGIEFDVTQASGVTTGIAGISAVQPTNASSADLVFQTRNAGTIGERMRIDSGGDISFYEDTGTTAKFFWDASAERLGIGEQSPDSALHITGTADSSSQIKLERTSVGTTVLGYQYVGTFSNNPFLFYANSAERMRISSSGVLSVGNTAPQTWHSNSTGVIQFGGMGALENYNSTDDVVILSANQYRASDGVFKYMETNEATRIVQYQGNIYFSTAPSGTADTAATFTDRLYITNAGLVGIGTSSPTTSLNIEAAGVSSAGENAHVRINDTTDMAAGVGGVIQLSGEAATGSSSQYVFGTIKGIKENGTSGNYDGALTFATRANGVSPASEAMRIDSSGNVILGQGLTGSQSLIFEDTNNLATGERHRIEFRNNSTARYAYIGAVYDSSGGGNGTSLAFATNAAGSGPAEAMRIDRNGRVIIGATSVSTSYPLTVQSSGTSTVHIKTTGVNGYAQLNVENDAKSYTIGVGASDQLYLYDATSSANRILITSSGNVGIGADSPSTTLHVKSSGFGDLYQLMLDDGSSNTGLEIGTYGSVGQISGATGLDFEINKSLAMRITTDGEVAINKTTVPNDSGGGYKTLVVSNEATSKSARFLAMGAASAYTSYAALTSGTHNGTTFYSPAILYTDSLRFFSAPLNNEPDDTNVTERMRLTTTGLGIGTSTPASKLNVYSGTDPAIIAASDEWGEQLEIHRANSSVNWPSIKFTNSSGELGRVFVDASNDYLMYVKAGGSNYETVWTNYTDGSGSGLDADLLDGQQGSYYLDTSSTAQTKSGLLTVSDLDVTGNEINGRKMFATQSATVAAAGWYRVATSYSAAGRGDAYIHVYTTGSSYTPYSLFIKAHFNWSSTGRLYEVNNPQGGYWSDVRLTSDGTNTYVEVYFTSAIAGNQLSIWSQSIGYDRFTPNSGTLASGGGTVQDSITLTGRKNFKGTVYGDGDLEITGQLDLEGPDGGLRLGTWTGGSTYAGLSTGNMANQEYVIITSGTSTFVSSGVGGTTNIRGPNNDGNIEITLDNSTVAVTGAMTTSANLTVGGDLIATDVDVSGTVQIGAEVILQESTDRSDLLQITSSTSTWAGLQIRNSSNEGRWSFMTDGENAGIYNDEDNQWHIYMTEAAGVQLRYAASAKLDTTSGGVAVTGALTATGDITAYYSDERLKNFEGKIDGALDKVSQLNGYYFRENDKAKELGYENDARQVGVSAQEVEAVLPEVIKPAPVDPEYKTVQYEKLVPLLIEAIKELKEEVRQLKEDKA